MAPDPEAADRTGEQRGLSNQTQPTRGTGETIQTAKQRQRKEQENANPLVSVKRNIAQCVLSDQTVQIIHGDLMLFRYVYFVNSPGKNVKHVVSFSLRSY